VTTPNKTGLQPVLLSIPDHWTPDAALAVFEHIDDLRDQIWSRYGIAIQDELRRQTDPDHDDVGVPTPERDA